MCRLFHFSFIFFPVIGWRRGRYSVGWTPMGDAPCPPPEPRKPRCYSTSCLALTCTRARFSREQLSIAVQTNRDQTTSHLTPACCKIHPQMWAHCRWGHIPSTPVILKSRLKLGPSWVLILRNTLEITVEERLLALRMCFHGQDDRPETRLQNGSFSPQNGPPCGTRAWYMPY